MKAKICICMPNFGQSYDAQIKDLESEGFEVVWKTKNAQTQDPATLIADTKGYDCVIAASERWNKTSLDGVAGSLKLIARHGVGVDNIDIPYATSKGIAVTSAPGQLTRAVAEMALCHIMSCFRRVARFDREIRSGVFASVITHCLTGKTVGLVGFGAIARELCRLLAPFQCDIIAYDVVKNEEAAKALGVTFVELDELIARADVVSLHVPPNAQTAGMVNRVFLCKMKKSAFLINTSRGGLVIEEDLFEALRDGTIAGAGLDVFASEYSDKKSVLFDCENAVLTPHSAANTYESIDAMMWSCVSSIKEFFSGKVPALVLNPDYVHHRRQV